jgi:hypothetical protein
MDHLNKVEKKILQDIKEDKEEVVEEYSSARKMKDYGKIDRGTRDS